MRRGNPGPAVRWGAALVALAVLATVWTTSASAAATPVAPAAATPAAPAAATPAAGESYLPLSPARLLDTRPGQTTVDGQAAGGGAVGAGVGNVRALKVTGRGGVPASGVAAVVLNVTVTGATAGSYLSVYPTGESLPLASNLNFSAGQTIPNLVIAKVGTGGNVSIYNNTGQVHVIADVAGWFPTGPAYTPLTPARLLDTRPGQSTVDGQFAGWGAVGAGEFEVLSLEVAGRGGVPFDGVSAVVLNVTVTGPTAASHLSVYPSGQEPPLASNLNFSAGQTIPNLVIVKLDELSGWVDIFNNAGNVHVIADVAGWFRQGDDYLPLSPARLLDSRPGQSTIDGQAAGGGAVGPGTAGVRSLKVTGRGGVPSTGATAVVLNVTVTGASAGSHLTVFPAGESAPLASNLNFSAGQTIPNLVIVKVGSGGNVNIFNNAGSVHVIADVAGWFAGADDTPPSAPTGLSASDWDGDVELWWNQVSAPDLVGYHVYRSSTSNGPWTKVTATPLVDPEHVDPGLDPGTWWYRVTAVDDDGNESAPSTSASVVLADSVPPPVPTGLTATPGDSSAQLAWTAVTASDLAGYNVYRSTSAGSAGTKVNGAPVATTAFTSTGLTNGTTYWFRVTSVDDDGNESATSPPQPATPVDTGPPPVPTGLTATPGDTTVQVAWTAVSAPDLAGYNVYRSTSSGAVGAKLNPSPVTTTSFGDTGLTNGTTYWYRVASVDTTGNESARTAPQSATPAVPPPTITTPGLPGAQTGLAYYAGLTATGGTAPYTWSIATGTLPAGLTLGAATGAITGTPTGTGTANVTVRVTGTGGASSTKALSIAVTAPAEWPQAGRDGGGRGWAPNDTALNATTAPGIGEEWSTTGTSGPTVLAGGVAYTQGNTPESPTVNGLLAHDVNTGARLWFTPLPDACNGSNLALAGDRIVVMSCGNVVAVRLAAPHDILWNTATTDAGASHQAVRVDATSVVAWSGQVVTRYRLSDGVRLWQQPSPTGASIVGVALATDRVVVTYSDRIRAFNLTTGAQAWQKLSTAGGMVVVADGFAYTVSSGSVLKLATGDGAQAWATPVDSVLDVYAVDGDTVYVYWGQFNFGDDTLLIKGLRTSDGTQAWELTPADRPRTVVVAGDLIWITWSGAGSFGGNSSGVTVYRRSDRSQVAQVSFPTRSFTTAAYANGHLVGTFAGRYRSIGLAPPVPAVTTEALGSTFVGRPYSEQLAATGGTGAHTWSVASGTLPTGITLSASGALSGTPTAPSAPLVTFRVTDARGRTATRALVVQVGAVGTAPWGTAGMDATRNGFAAAEGTLGKDTAAQLGQRWKTAAMGPGPYSAQQRSVVAAADRLHAVGEDGLLYAWSSTGTADNRSALWTAAADPGATFVSTPTVVGGNVHVIGSDGAVYVVRASDGVRQWRAPTGSTRQDTYGAPLVAGGRVVFVDADNKVWAVDLGGTHAVVWGPEVLPNVSAGVGLHQSLSSDGTRAYVMAGCLVTAFTLATGDVAWTRNYRPDGQQFCDMWSASTGRTTVVGDVVMAQAGWYSAALDRATGSVLWVRQTGPDAGSGLGLAASNGIVVLPHVRWNCCNQGWHYTLGAYDLRTGAEIWSSETWTYSAPSVAGDLVLFRTANGLAGVDLLTGDPLWTSSVVDTVQEVRMDQPAIAGGKVFIVGYDRTVRAFGPP